MRGSRWASNFEGTKEEMTEKENRKDNASIDT